VKHFLLYNADTCTYTYLPLIICHYRRREAAAAIDQPPFSERELVSCNKEEAFTSVD
jgi:hypothetical protein